MTPLLSVRDLRKWFELRKWVFGRAGHVRALDGVSFDLARGEAIAIVGESGCGKSTLVKTILGLHKPTSGEVVFDGDRSQIGYIQQDPYGALAPFMTVRRILDEPLIINRERNREARIRQALEEVRLTPVDDFLPKFPHQLSGGQQQRVVIARAMILKPKLLIADEPVSMLDASVRIGILDLLRGIQTAHNLGVIYITHDLSTVRHFAERIFVMYAGNIVEKAETAEFLEHPLHPYTQALLDAIPDPDPDNAARLKTIPPGEPPSLVQPPSGCRFHPRCPHFMKGVCEVREIRELHPRIAHPGGDRRHGVMCWLYEDEEKIHRATERA